jgi:flagellar hook-basal body complex protein FliE
MNFLTAEKLAAGFQQTSKALLGKEKKEVFGMEPAAPEAKTFEQTMLDALNEVSAYQTETENLSEQLLINPDSVEPHQMTIAMAKASTSLNLAKGIIDRAIKAYKEIISLR